MKKIICYFLFFSILLGVITLGGCDNGNTASSSNKQSNAISDADDQLFNIVPPTITFQTNGGSTIPKQTTKVLKDAPETTKKNHLFDGWYLDEKLTKPVIFPLSVEYDTTLYAKWLKIYAEAEGENFSISSKSGYYSLRSYDVTSDSLDMQALAQKNMKVKVTVYFDVSYRKDYDFFVGYMGAPKYEVYLLEKNDLGDFKENVTAPSTSTQRTLSFTMSAQKLLDNHITFTASTDNIQNVIYFKNFHVTHECV